MILKRLDLDDLTASVEAGLAASSTFYASLMSASTASTASARDPSDPQLIAQTQRVLAEIRHGGADAAAPCRRRRPLPVSPTRVSITSFV